MMNSKIEINTLDKLRLPFKKGDIKKTAQKILSLLVLMPQISSCKTLSRQDFQTISFEISFCTDRLIREINRDYRSKDKATDVITFALFADDENSIIQNDTLELGEIIISIDTLISQAQENGNTIEKELYTLITHGILHLLGFENITQKDYDFVVGIQEAIVNNL